MKFIETIKVKDGAFYNLEWHQKRLSETVNHFYHKDISLNLSNEQIPPNMRGGLVKCRIIYADKILFVEFLPYTFKHISELEVVRCDDIEYPFKYENREVLNNLRTDKKNSDILIIKHGLVTDTSFANVVFENESGLFTPRSYLLNGTKRQKLLYDKVIKEADIMARDIPKYSKLYLINAMIDIEDNISVPVSSVK